MYSGDSLQMTISHVHCTCHVSDDIDYGMSKQSFEIMSIFERT